MNQAKLSLSPTPVTSAVLPPRFKGIMHASLFFRDCLRTGEAPSSPIRVWSSRTAQDGQGETGIRPWSYGDEKTTGRGANPFTPRPAFLTLRCCFLPLRLLGPHRLHVHLIAGASLTRGEPGEGLLDFLTDAAIAIGLEGGQIRDHLGVANLHARQTVHAAGPHRRGG